MKWGNRQPFKRFETDMAMYQPPNYSKATNQKKWPRTQRIEVEVVPLPVLNQSLQVELDKAGHLAP